MCDYSLHGVANRPAKVGDRLVSTRFLNSFTRGFTEVGEPKVAVCLLPGTELKVDDPLVAEYRNPFLRVLHWMKAVPRREFAAGVAKFTQVNLDKPDTHHDALRFPDGSVVLLTDLLPDQKATVLQLPIKGDQLIKAQMREHGVVDVDA